MRRKVRFPPRWKDSAGKQFPPSSFPLIRTAVSVRRNQQDFADQMEKAGIPAEFHTIISTKGHDSFLLEPELYAEPIRRILG